jgi:hypothetical protein
VKQSSTAWYVARAHLGIPGGQLGGTVRQETSPPHGDRAVLVGGGDRRTGVEESAEYVDGAIPARDRAADAVRRVVRVGAQHLEEQLVLVAERAVEAALAESGRLHQIV